ncbi:hypothetical protein ONZ45_g1507 [Pleurotus djamor]|nr:hypothetical protein ONZ45_g1507 [Pleurotus djamor]
MSGLNGSQDFSRTNQAIVDGRPAGRQPEGARVTVDTLIDKDASLPQSEENTYLDPSGEYPGATSADVHGGYGHPGQGMSSKELRHDGKIGRKGGGQGISQWGPPAEKEKVLGKQDKIES